MQFVDLHIHSRFSRGTSKHLDIHALSHWGKIKGLNLLGTGDCTHLKWLKELEEVLTFSEEIQLYEYAGLNYILQGEISCIYKKNNRTRRVHHIVFFPHFQGAYAFEKKLAKFGNTQADGRPILKLDSKHLLEMILEIPNAFLIPAHVWTPWYSLFGEKSGFNSIEECFEDLTPYIFALETGLSSDVTMNRLCSQLNSYAFISNSDAHSGQNLAREVNIFEGKITYTDLFKSLHLETKNQASCSFLGTVEMYPQLGKYYASGHRACSIFHEKENIKTCTVCHKPLTQGVLQRILDFKDFAKQEKEIFLQKEWYCVPLISLLSSLLHTGESSKKVQDTYTQLLKNTTELNLLLETTLEDLPLLVKEAIINMRAGKVQLEVGYDGQYGKIIL